VLINSAELFEGKKCPMIRLEASYFHNSIQQRLITFTFHFVPVPPVQINTTSLVKNPHSTVSYSPEHKFEVSSDTHTFELKRKSLTIL
jgi:hypothetical protein